MLLVNWLSGLQRYTVVLVDKHEDARRETDADAFPCRLHREKVSRRDGLCYWAHSCREGSKRSVALHSQSYLYTCNVTWYCFVRYYL